MSAIRVRLDERSYAIVVTNSFRQLPARLAQLGLGRHGWVISHESVLRRYGRDLVRPLTGAGWTIKTLAVPESERSKSLAWAERVIMMISRQAAMRVPVLFAFGGGVIGDLAGFAAAVYRRGVPYVQVPTTLLAQVDSAIGGKVGVDLPHAKNLVGAFHQPRLVWNNLAVLRSLPMRQRRSGLAEIIKYGMIGDATLFRYLEEHLHACLALELRALRVMVERSCRSKAAVVARDERETGAVRARLNFGHTLGHALEAASGYRRWTHGEAIAIGMCAAARLSVELGLLAAGSAGRLTALIQAAGLPVEARGVSRGAVLSALRYDKKFVRGRPRWVLPTGIGRVVVTESVPPGLAERVIAEFVR
jgi:3-dehydroquinate synthase